MLAIIATTAYLVVEAPSVTARGCQVPVLPGHTFRGDVSLTVETVTVRDKDGTPIEGLGPKDFTVTEDGDPQQVAFVEFQRIAATPRVKLPEVVGHRDEPAPTLIPVVRDQISSTLGNGGYRDRRLLVMWFDLTAMSLSDQSRALNAAQKFVRELMTSPDMVAIMTYDGGGVKVKQDFTDDRARLLEVIRVLMFGEDVDGDGIRDRSESGNPFGADEAEFNIFNTNRQLSALQTALSLLGSVPEQKALVYFASGVQLSVNDNLAQLRATANAAIRANVSINPIDARGLVAEAPMGDATRQSPGGPAMFTGRVAERATKRFQESQDTLYSLAKDTGGTALFDYSDLSIGILKAADTISSYYVLAFYSTHTAKDGRFRRVRVALTGGLSGELSYRRGYFAEKTFAQFTSADKERQLEEALMLQNPITEIGMAMEVNYFKINRAEYFVPVSVRIPGSELAVARRRGGRGRTKIDFIGEVKDANGATVQNVRDKIDIQVSEDTISQLSTSPLYYETGFTLLPGKYVIKVLARDAETGRIGTYETPFTIPNLVREQQHIPISSVILGVQRVPVDDALYSVKGALEGHDPLVAEGKKLLPSVSRVFSRRRALYVFLQAYPHDLGTTHPLVVFLTFLRDGEKVFETLPLMVEGVEEPSHSIPLRLSASLSAIPDGEYECQVTVLDPASQKAAFWRAPLVVVP